MSKGEKADPKIRVRGLAVIVFKPDKACKCVKSRITIKRLTDSISCENDRSADSVEY